MPQLQQQKQQQKDICLLTTQCVRIAPVPGVSDTRNDAAAPVHMLPRVTRCFRSPGYHCPYRSWELLRFPPAKKYKERIMQTKSAETGSLSSIVL